MSARRANPRLANLAQVLNSSVRRAERRPPTAERRAENNARRAAALIPAVPVAVPRRRRNNARLRNELTELRLSRQEELNTLRQQLARQYSAALAQRQANIRSALTNQFANMSRQVNSYAANRGRVQANANSKRKLLNAINKVKNIVRITGQPQQYLALVNAIRNYSELPKNSALLNARANAIFRAYGALPGGGGLGPKTKLKVARKLQNLAKIYSNRHGNALYEAGLRYGTSYRGGSIIRAVARRLA